MIGRSPRVLLAVACVLLATCGSERLAPIPFTIGPEGGTIELADGQLVLAFPPGAVSGAITFSATAVTGPAAPTLVSGTVFDLAPSMTFAQPVSVTISYAQLQLPTGVKEDELGIYKAVNNAWQAVAGATVNPSAKTIAVSVTSFSTYGILGAPVANVIATPASSTLNPGGSVQVTAEARDASNNLLEDRPITFSSSNTSVASVNAAGLVTANAVGTAEIVAASDEGPKDTTAVNVQATVVPVASVVATPATATLFVTETVQITAEARDANNNLLPGRPISFSSLNSTVASVNATGLVTANAVGTAQIVAASEDGPKDTSLIVVQAPSANNEPSGFTVVSDRAWNTLGVCSQSATREAGWDEVEGCPQVNGGNLTIITDDGAPFSALNVAQMRYPQGFQGGSSPAVAQLNVSSSLGYKQLYIRYFIKVSSSFEGHPTGTNKVFHFWIGTPAGNRVFDRIVAVGQAPLDYQVALQGVPDSRSRLTGNLGVSTTFQRNKWYKIEILMIANTPGQANGIVRAWMDGQKVIEYTDVQIMAAGESPVWSQVQWSPTWGGGGGTTSVLFHMWLDHTYVSGRQ